MFVRWNYYGDRNVYRVLISMYVCSILQNRIHKVSCCQRKREIDISINIENAGECFTASHTSYFGRDT